jgi:hypothetical protein
VASEGLPWPCKTFNVPSLQGLAVCLQAAKGQPSHSNEPVCPCTSAWSRFQGPAAHAHLWRLCDLAPKVCRQRTCPEGPRPPADLSRLLAGRKSINIDFDATATKVP